MGLRARKFALTMHVVSSVGWLGAVAAFLGLAVAGLASDEAETVRSVYIAMEATGWFVLVPLALASFITGVVQSLGTKWGLFRHYWVLVKLVINLVASVILVMYMDTLAGLADTATAMAASGGHLGGLRSGSPILHAAGALFLLVVATVLGVYKPKGLTRYGWRKQRKERIASQP